MKKVLLIFGGNSSEHYVSCLSAKSIIENIDRSKYDITIVGIYKTYWFLFDDDLSYLENGNWLESKNNSKIFNIIDFIQKFDVVFPILHGKNGEDGKIQGMFELFDIKYVGCNTLSSAIGMDKEISKILFKHLGIPIAPYICQKYPKIKINEVIKKIGFPLIVKPANGGSSIGITKANNKRELIKAIEIAHEYDKKIIFEKFIKARELECAVLENKKLHVSTVGEIILKNDIYDYNSKYFDSAETIVPSNIPKNIQKQIKEYAEIIFKNIEAKGLSRVDFFYDEEKNKVYVNEINTMPGFTVISMYPSLLIYDKISYKEIITHLIENENR